MRTVFCILGLLFVMMVIVTDQVLQRSLGYKGKCESKGGVYSEPRGVGPQCIDQRSIIKLN